MPHPVIYICIYVCVCVCVCVRSPAPSQEQDLTQVGCNTRSILKQVFTDLNSYFYFPKTGCQTIIKEHSS